MKRGFIVRCLSATCQAGSANSAALWLQAALLAATGPLLVVPMQEGPMLFRPLHPMNDAQAINWIIGHDARLIRRASGSGAFYIQGRPSALLLPALANAVILLRTDITGCGPQAREIETP